MGVAPALWWWAGVLLAVTCGCGRVAAEMAPPEPPAAAAADAGHMAAQPASPPWARARASWYSHRFVGKRTASGELYRKEAFSAAHRTLPMGALVVVRNPANRRQVVVRINDRGPHTRQRDIDLSHAAAKTLGVAHQGVATVEWQLAPPGARATAPLRVSPPARLKPKPPRHVAKPSLARRR